MASGFKYGGYRGQMLRVNLTKKGIVKEPLREDWARDFVGGVGYSARLLYEELPPKIDPLGPLNKLVFMTGPVNGTMIPAASRSCACAKSPLTGSFFHSIFGGYFGPELKFAGYDGLVVEGKSEQPVYLWIDDDRVEIINPGGLPEGMSPKTLGKLSIRTDDELRMYTSFYRRADGGSPFTTFSVSKHSLRNCTPALTFSPRNRNFSRSSKSRYTCVVQRYSFRGTGLSICPPTIAPSSTPHFSSP